MTKSQELFICLSWVIKSVCCFVFGVFSVILWRLGIVGILGLIGGFISATLFLLCIFLARHQLNHYESS
jgi:hypothetical protein